MNANQNTGLDITTLVVALLTFIGLVANLIWSYYAFRQQRNDSIQQRKEAAENTEQLNKLQKEIEQSNRIHDQKVQRLYRAREAVIAVHKAHVYLINYGQNKVAVWAEEQIGKRARPLVLDDNYFIKSAELSAAQAELRGLAFAIGDKELLHQVNNPIDNRTSDDKRINAAFREIDIRANSQHLHTRITELLEIETKTD